MNIIHKTRLFVQNILFPPMCATCKKFNESNTRRNICDNCFSKIKTNQIFTQVKPSVILAASGSYDNAILRNLIHALKYDYMEESAKTLTEVMLKYINQVGLLNLLDTKKTIITPIPLHKSKLRERGFNQSELIAKLIAEKLNIPVANLLKRVKKTHPQIKMQDDIERAKNTKNCFELNISRGRLTSLRTSDVPNIENVETLILIDDVYTSGATTGEAIKVLNKLKPKKIIILTAARA